MIRRTRLATREQRNQTKQQIATAIACARREIWIYGAISTLLFAAAFALFL